MQVGNDLLGDVAEVRLVRRDARRDVVEGRVHAGAPCVAHEVAPVERVVAEVVEVLDIVGGDAEPLVAVERLWRSVRRRIDPRVQLQLLLDHHLVLGEREVHATDRRVRDRVEGPRRRQQCRVVAGHRLDPQAAEDDPVAVAVVERRGVVVQRVRVTERPPGQRVGALRDLAVGARHPHLGVGGAREHVPAVDHDAVGRDLGAHALVPLPVAVRVGEDVRRVGLERRDLVVRVHAGAHDLDQRQTGAELREVEELRHASGEHDLVPRLGRVGATARTEQGREAPHEHEDAVGRVRVTVVGRVGVLEEEAILRAPSAGSREGLLVDHALDREGRIPGGVAAGRREGRSVQKPGVAITDRSLHRPDRDQVCDVHGERAGAALW